MQSGNEPAIPKFTPLTKKIVLHMRKGWWLNPPGAVGNRSRMYALTPPYGVKAFPIPLRRSTINALKEQQIIEQGTLALSKALLAELAKKEQP